MTEELTTDVTKINTKTKQIELLKKDDTTWKYKYKSFEISEEIEELLLERQKDNWKVLALATFKRKDPFLTLKELLL